MAQSFAQPDYWAIVEESYYDSIAVANTVDDTSADELETWPFPTQLGTGYFRKIDIREGLVFDVADYRLHEDVTLVSDDREHPLELTFTLVGAETSNLSQVQAGQHCFCGSGLAPGAVHEKLAHQRKLEVSIHIDPSLLRHWVTDGTGPLPPPLQHLVKPDDQCFFTQVCATPAAMQQVVRQMLRCPFQGLTQRMYLESKVWELMALQLAQIPSLNDVRPGPQPLKPEDVERIHYARDILLERLNHPPSLLELARLVGINDCKLKAGFRQVFGTTVFGYLHDCRLEQARQLLSAGEMSVAAAAQSVGYANRSHFAIAFRKKYGINPSTYRKRQARWW